MSLPVTATELEGGFQPSRGGKRKGNDIPQEHDFIQLAACIDPPFLVSFIVASGEATGNFP